MIKIFKIYKKKKIIFIIQYIIHILVLFYFIVTFINIFLVFFKP